ncbi:MAG: FAD-dependent oxidoreductase [Alphaproteobacteria bacterium]
MSEILKPDLCVIGAGSGGLSVAAGAAQIGASVVLIEKHKMGGDCLNYGCVPSKALLAAGKHAHHMRTGAPFGVTPVDPQIDFSKAMDHVHETIAKIEPHDSVERFEGLGCTVIQAPAKFINNREVEAGGKTVRPRRFVIATGSRPAVPDIAGLADVPYFTNETLFENRACPEHLIVLGGGPIGLEMAQAHHRLGARVTVLARSTIASKEDDELVAILRDQLKNEGIEIVEQAQVQSCTKTVDGLAVRVLIDGAVREIAGSHLLVATGRVPNVEGLDLGAAGIAHQDCGITVDKGLRTSNKRAFAIGDVTGGPQFTHVAGYHAGIIIRRTLFRTPAKADHSAVPRVTYTDPELAQIGLTEEDAKAKNITTKIVEWPLSDNDRAVAERIEHGLVKIICAPNGKILGAGLVGPGAGELMAPLILAISQGLKIGAFASLIIPYPTLGEVPKRAAGSWYTPMLYSDRTRMIVKLLSKLG